MSTAPDRQPRRHTAVAVLCGGLVLAVVVLALLLSPGGADRSAGAAAAPPSRPAEVWPTAARSEEPSPPAPVTPVPAEPAAPSSAPPAPAPPAPGQPSAAPTVPGPPAAGAGAAPAQPVATPAPEWLGTRALAPAGSGPVAPQTTPPELQDRRLLTVDVLPPPADGRFAPVVSDVPADVLARSTWQPACPVTPDELRYLLVQHWGFDGRPHTGEVLVHADAVDAVVAVFAAMHEEGFPLEEVRVVRADELDAAPTGDGNVTSAFVCRPSVGGGGWSRHAYGRALDVNPFHNPYDRGRGEDRLVLPELATAYTDRDRVLPGMLSAGSGAVVAAEAAGWGWGGRWDSAKDWMHLSDDGS